MKIASVSEIKQELLHKPSKELVALCLELAKFKKDNKELLTYLLFESHDLHSYINSVKKEMEEQYGAINTSHLYYAKKSLRKILRLANKYIKHTGSKEAEAEILIHYCTLLKDSGIRIHKSTSLTKLYEGQLKKITSAIATLHEDLRYEYARQVQKLEL